MEGGLAIMISGLMWATTNMLLAVRYRRASFAVNVGLGLLLIAAGLVLYIAE